MIAHIGHKATDNQLPTPLMNWKNEFEQNWKKGIDDQFEMLKFDKC